MSGSREASAPRGRVGHCSESSPLPEIAQDAEISKCCICFNALSRNISSQGEVQELWDKAFDAQK